MVGEEDEYFRKLVSQLDSEESELPSESTMVVASDILSTKPMITSDFDKLGICTSDPTSGGHVAVDLTSEIMGIDWDDIPDSLKATEPMPDKTPIVPASVAPSIFTMTGNVERMLDEGGEFEMGELQQLDRLQQLRRHHQGLALPHHEPRG